MPDADGAPHELSARRTPHRHATPLRGTRVVPRPREGDPLYQPLNYAYAGVAGNVHEVVRIGGRELAKVGFPDRKIVYYLLADLEIDAGAERRTFHDDAP